MKNILLGRPNVNRHCLTVAFFCVAIIGGTAAAQVKAPAPALSPDSIQCKPSKAPIFQSEASLPVTLSGNFPNQNSDPQPGTLTVGYKGAEKAIPFQMTSRGHSRLDACAFSPLSINFGKDFKKSRVGTPFEGMKGTKFKLVDHCDYSSGEMDQSDAANQNVIKEYFLYKALKAAGYPALEARLVKAKYVDESGNLVVSGMGFFLETKGDLAKRCGDSHFKIANDSNWNVVADWYTNMDKTVLIPFLFAEELGRSWDWIEYSGHNSIPISVGGKVIALSPYDFNDAGLVNARGPIEEWGDDETAVALASTQNWINAVRQGPVNRSFSSIDISDAEQAVWKTKVLAEAKRLLGRKSAVLKALSEAPIADKSEFTAYYQDFFGTLKRFVDSGGAELN